ncbi:MAG: phosphoribosylformylglycinamidine synthase subunit PurL [Deltaproteobacteria bacterium]|nr:phosphoribosylformylglycinamidine synthase subunit PurL [Deltaproteobacteria bacterium]
MADPEITPEIVKEHGLTPDEYQKIIRSLGREPTWPELGVFSVMWSEHCSYKSSRVHLKKFPTSGPRVLQGPGENAGVIDAGDGIALVFKMESHNHPSFIEPYQGAATGVGGILRDVFTMGARPIANLNSLRFGAPDHPKTAHLLSGVVSGIGGYGNCVGVATVGGEVYFNPCYNGNPLVNAFTMGVARTDRIFKGLAEGVGNPVIYVGSKTGRDGIHGATMASESFDETSGERRPTVQVGDPFTEKLLIEACLELMAKDSIVGIQDMGAAGLTSSSVEMASRAGSGLELDIDRIPRRETGMTPYEILLSESQERMLIVARKGREQEVIDIFRRWDLDVEIVGKVTDSGRWVVTENGKPVCDIPVPVLVDDAPVYNRPVTRPPWQDEVQKLDLDSIPLPRNYNDVLLRLLASPNICSREWIWRQYDNYVGKATILPSGSDAALVKLPGVNRAAGLTVNCNSRYCYLDPRTGGAIAVAECARNLVASGCEPVALTDCLNFGNPERPEIMWQFAEAIEGMAEACRVLETPVVSGNVSLYNETLDVGIYPTPSIAMVGLLQDLGHRTVQWFQKPGDRIVLIGRTREELGGSEYLQVIHGLEKGMPPALDLAHEKAVQKAVLEAIRAGLIRSAHDCSEGGLAVALAECGFGDPRQHGERLLGAAIEIEDYIREDALLFGESQSRMVVTVANETDFDRLLAICTRLETGCREIGVVQEGTLVINGLVNVPVKDLYQAWRTPIAKIAGEN